MLAEGKRNTEWAVEEGSYKCPATVMGPAIEMRAITITDAWRVSIHDNTRNALEWDDEPIIPNNELKTSPVLELLENLRELHDKRL